PNTVVRSRQTSSDVANMGMVAGGIAGARGNLPTAAPTPPGAQGNPQSTAPTPPAQAVPTAVTTAASIPGSSRTTETTNYEVSRTTSRTIAPPGDVARISVAVILDDNHVLKPGPDGKPVMTRVSRTPEELQKLQAHVAASVGLDPE